MAIFVFHGEKQEESVQALSDKISQLRQEGYSITNLTGKELTPALLQEATEQSDFFGGQKAVVIRGLFSRPKSKVRDSLVEMILQSEAEIILFEAKQITPTTLKPFKGKAQIFESRKKSAIWKLLSTFSPDNNNKNFIEAYETACEEQGEMPAVYLTAMLLWQIQQLIDVKQNNFHGAPFVKTRMQSQARKFSLEELFAWHQKLVQFDYRQKSTAKKLPDFKEELLLVLLGVVES
ncbi:hypothetical protein IJJ27_04275 [bacterium]|nr:hypothetical protein [bacterium]